MLYRTASINCVITNIIQNNPLGLTEERNSYRFEDDRIFIFGWTITLSKNYVWDSQTILVFHSKLWMQIFENWLKVVLSVQTFWNLQRPQVPFYQSNGRFWLVQYKCYTVFTVQYSQKSCVYKFIIFKAPQSYALLRQMSVAISHHIMRGFSSIPPRVPHF